MDYVVGIDGGGSNTTCAVSDLKANIVATARSGPSNYKLVGKEKTRSNLKKALFSVIEKGNIKADNLKTAFFALAGLDNETDEKNIESMLERLVSEIIPGANYQFDNDAIASLNLGSPDGTGIVLICGTGSNCVAVNSRGRRIQIGGLGREFGDYAGGYEIAVLALGAAIRGNDGRGKPTILYDYLCDHLGLEKLIDFEPIYYKNPHSYSLADFAPLVFKAAQNDDKVANEILEYNGRELALSAEVALKKIFSAQEKVNIILTGGIFKNESADIVINTIDEKIKKEHQETKIIVPPAAPVIGSIIYALRMYGVIVDKKLKNKLISDYISN